LNAGNSGKNGWIRRDFAIFNVSSPQCCPRALRHLAVLAGDSPAQLGNWTMTLPPGPAGFASSPAPADSSRLADAVAASLAIASLSLCLIVTLTVFSIKASMAMPIPA
jgi:hypothetical protein